MDEKPTKVVGRRFVAALIDGIASTAIIAVVFFALAGDPAEGLANGDLELESTVYGNLELGDKTYSVYGGKAAIFFLLWFLLTVGWYIIWPGLKGVTLGKLAMGIKVIKEDGSGPPGIGRAIARYLLWIVDGLFIGLVGFITAMASKKNQRVGDMVASTIVVKKDAVISAGAAPAAAATEPPPGIPFQDPPTQS